MILKDRVSIITGASGGIGRAIAEAFAREGSSIVLVSHNAPELEKTKRELGSSSARLEIFAADVSKKEDVKGMVGFTLAKFGTIDILVNCAGVYGPIGLTTDISAKDWFDAVKINLFGTFLCTKAVLPIMMKKKSGKILNFSGGGAVSPGPRFTAYSASKAGVIRLTETLAAKFKDSNIGIHAIAPGPVNSRILGQVLSAGAAAGEEELVRALKQKGEGGVPPRQVAELAVLLASMESDGLSGRLISLPWDNWKDITRHTAAIMSSDVYTARRIVPKERGYDW